MDLYADNILDHYKHPHHKMETQGIASLQDPTVVHTEKNLSCGDVLTIQLTIKDDHIAEIGWSGEGCAISQAAMSMLAEELMGTSIPDIDALTPQDIKDLLGVPISNRRIKCALLSLHTLKNAMHDLRKEPAQGWTETVGNEKKDS